MHPQEAIRLMLRDQQRANRALHSNALFREFRSEAKQAKRFGKGYAPAATAGAADAAAPAQIDDFQAEGASRMFALIKSTAEQQEKPLQGVWAAFGKPYISNGPPTDVSFVCPRTV